MSNLVGRTLAGQHIPIHFPLASFCLEGDARKKERREVREEEGSMRQESVRTNVTLAAIYAGKFQYLSLPNPPQRKQV